MTRRLLVLLPCAAVCLAGASVAHAQGTITDGNTVFQRGATPFDGTPDASFRVTGGAGTDHVFEFGWWFRLSAGTAEAPLGTPTSQVYSGNTSTITWTGLGGGAFNATEVAVVKDTSGGAGGQGYARATLTINNVSGAPLGINIFNYVDYDLSGSVTNDRARLLFRQNHMRVEDGTSVAEYKGVGAGAHQVTTFATLRTLLNDAAVTNLNNTGLPFGGVAGGDFTGGTQWTATIPTGGSASFTAIIEVGLSLVRGDFNDDSKSDLLFRNSIFTRHVVWTMDGMTRTAGIFVTPDVVDTDNRAFCTDDFSGDQRADILFRNVSTGAMEFWVMGGPTGTDRQSILPLAGTTPLPTNWIIAACGDVNRDGKSDILWRDTAGVHELRVWLMNDNTWVADLTPTPASALDNNWTVVALLDFNGDGNIDFHWFNETSGNNVQWYMDSAFVRLFGQFTSPTTPADNNWKVVAAGDYAQGKLGLPPVGAGDVIFRNDTSGRIVGWIMDGQASVSVGNTRLEGLFTCPVEVGGGCDPSVPPNPGATSWFIIGPR